ncbi:MAG: 23S rRNA pseudouridine(1911/1915/1917) synthase RluD [Pseudomonadota bacterium]
MALIIRTAELDLTHQGRRLDQAAAELFPEFSRSRIQQWIRAGSLTLNDTVVQPKQSVQAGDRLSLQADLVDEHVWEARDLPLQWIYEDEQIVVINKPAGLVVHPAAGHADDTLVNALLHRYPELSQVPRAGIVHRLDKETSGLLVVARTLEAHHSLVQQLQQRTVKRGYICVVRGIPPMTGTVNAPIGRHPSHRTRMAVLEEGKVAITHFKIQKNLKTHAVLAISLETGRTHQIRVHMAHLGFPVVGDPMYSGRRRVQTRSQFNNNNPRQNEEALRNFLATFSRQALHAHTLELEHPTLNRTMAWCSPITPDIQKLIAILSNADEA